MTDYHIHRNQSQELDDVSLVLDEAYNKINEKSYLNSLKQERVTYNCALFLILGVIVSVIFLAVLVPIDNYVYETAMKPISTK